MNKLLAQAQTQTLPPIGGSGLGPFANPAQTGEGAINNIAAVISTIIGLITIVAGLYFMFQFIIGALNWIGASGDKNKLQSAQDRMSNAVVGLIIVVAAFAIVSIVGAVLGFQSFLLQDPAELIDQLQLGGGAP